MYIRLHVYVYVHTSMYEYVYIFIYVHMYVRRNGYMYVYILIDIYIYMCVPTASWAPFRAWDVRGSATVQIEAATTAARAPWEAPRLKPKAGSPRLGREPLLGSVEGNSFRKVWDNINNNLSGLKGVGAPLD